MIEFAIKENFKWGTRFILAFLALLFIGFFKEYTIIVWTFKALVCTLIGMKWLKYITIENRMSYFKISFLCVGLYWVTILVISFAKGKTDSAFIFLSALLWIVALILMFKRGNYFLKIINKYYPDVMKKYNSSNGHIGFLKIAYPENVEKLEKELLILKETASPIVVDAIKKRETIKPILFFHLEMIFLGLMMIW